LGSVNVRLDDLPSSGVDKWCDLEARSEKSKVEGKIRLRLKLATKEDRGVHEEDSWDEIKQQEQMLSVFINYELAKQIDRKNREWRGDLCREAETILHQHAIQGDITDFQIALM
jgi:BAI1-associated protein 3